MSDTERLAALLIEVFPTANRNQWPFAAMDVAAALVAAGVRVGYPDLDVERDEFGFHDIPVPDSVVDEAPDGLGVERVAGTAPHVCRCEHMDADRNSEP